MSKVTTPEPRWHAAMHGQALYGVFDTPEAAFEAVSDTPGLMTIDRLITTTQAEAYADARVREVLEAAIEICDAAYEQGRREYRASCNPYFVGGCDVADSIESKIRALTPPQQ